VSLGTGGSAAWSDLVRSGQLALRLDTHLPLRRLRLGRHLCPGRHLHRHRLLRPCLRPGRRLCRRLHLHPGRRLHPPPSSPWSSNARWWSPPRRPEAARRWRPSARRWWSSALHPRRRGATGGSAGPPSTAAPSCGNPMMVGMDLGAAMTSF
jgi:hypothetical protein